MAESANAQGKDELLTPEQAASFLGLKVATLADMRVKGTSPVFCKAGRLVRYWKSDLIGYLKARSYRSTSYPQPGAGA